MVRVRVGWADALTPCEVRSGEVLNESLTPDPSDSFLVRRSEPALPYLSSRLDLGFRVYTGLVALASRNTPPCTPSLGLPVRE